MRWCVVHQGMPNRCAPGRIWLIAEESRDEAADILRAGGAKVTEVHTAGQAEVHTEVQADMHAEVHPDTECADAHELEPPSLVVITSSKTGRALVNTVSRFSEQDFVGMTILVCDHAGPLDVRLLLQAGVRGIVLREQMAETLLPAVAAVASGQVCVPTRDVIGAERPVLSIREKQVMGLVAMGLMNIEIAERLFLAESTVKSHLSSAFGKLGVRSRHEAVELLLNPASGLGLGILSLDAEAIPAGASVADLH